jgi:hypothetical protein
MDAAAIESRTGRAYPWLHGYGMPAEYLLDVLSQA